MGGREEERSRRRRNIRRKKSRRGGKRGRAAARREGCVKLKILHSNIRGFISKQESLTEILENVNPDICNLNETNLRGNRKIKLKNYVSFSKNREIKKMGGVSTSFQNYLRQYVVKVSDNAEVDEYLVTRLENVVPVLNILNIYGQIEARAGGPDKILESWGRIKKELSMIEARGEAVLILGDLNRAVGNDNLGVAGNSSDLSYGGKLVRDLLATEEYVMFNNLALVEGGPWTREDPGDGSLSCLDLAIGSRTLLPFLESMVVDSTRKFTPKRAVYNQGKLTVRPTDHYSLLLVLKMPRKEKKQKQPTIWNKRRPGGWEAYEKETDAAKENMEKVINDEEIKIEDVMKKLDAIQTKIKHATLGKTKLKSKKMPDKDKEVDELTDEEHGKMLMRKQSEKIENAILKVTSSKVKGCGPLFKMRDVVQGPRKAGQEAHAVVDSRSGELVVATSAIQKASLEYCLDNLKKNEPKEGFKKLIETKRKLHELRMLQTDGNFDVTRDLFSKVMTKFESKKKRSYDFLTRAGQGFKEAIFKFSKRLNLEEVFPNRFDETVLVQLYKLKGPVQQLSSHRYLHIKEWTARLVEALEVEGMRGSILEAGTRFQLGGKPGMRVQYHLFTVKSVMALKVHNKEGGILWGVDFKSFFDKEVLVDCLDTAAEAKIDPRIYRNWFRLNRRCRVSVVTGSGSGITEMGEAGETVGQGSSGASLMSQLKVDLGIHSYFSGSRDEECYGDVRLQPLSWQDDVVGLGSEVRLVQASLTKLSYFVDESQLDIHPDRSKSSYMMFGEKRCRQKLIEETEENPLMVGTVKLERSEAMTYLGEVLHQDGLAASVDATVDRRNQSTVRGLPDANLWRDGGGYKAIQVVCSAKAAG